jgi:hypothetical protein
MNTGTHEPRAGALFTLTAVHSSEQTPLQRPVG